MAGGEFEFFYGRLFKQIPALELKLVDAKRFEFRFTEQRNDGFKFTITCGALIDMGDKEPMRPVKLKYIAKGELA